MWLTLIAALILTVILFLAKAWVGRGSGVNLGQMSEQWLAENRNSHQ